MRKLLTAGIFGTILSLTGANYAGASIISRGFFDEAMENYATNTALDLKANQTDLTALSNKIGTLPSGNFPPFSGAESLFSDLNQPLTYPTSLAELINAIYGNSETNPPGLLAAIFEGIPSYSAEDPVGVIPNYYLAKNANNKIGTVPDGKNLAGMISETDAKIGTLPTETAMSSCSVWRAIDLTQNEMPETIGGILDQLYSAGHKDGSCDHDGYNGPSLPNIIRRLIYGYNYNGGTIMMGINGLNVGSTDSTGNVIEPGLRQITNGWTDAKGGIINPGLKGMYDGWTEGNYTFPGLFTLSSDDLKFKSIFGQSVGSLLSSGLDKFTSPEYTGPLYPLWKLSQGIDQIGTLPDGITLQGLYEQWNYEVSDFVSLLKSFWSYSDARSTLDGINPEKFSNDIHGAFYAIYTIFDSIFLGLSYGWRDINTNTYYSGIIDLNEGWLDKSTNTTYQGVKGLNDVIGTLPSGNLPKFPEIEFLFSDLDQPLTYPTSLAELINAIYGNSKTKEIGLLGAIISGFPFDFDNDGSIDAPLGLRPNYVLAKDAHDKIGTLPTQISGGNTVWARYGFETPIELPTTVGGMFDMLFYDKANSTEVRFSLSGIMGRILAGLYKDDGSVSFHGLNDLTSALELRSGANYPLVTAVNANTAAIEKIGTVPDGKNLAGMISETDAKIGTVPAGYDNVGAALTAMKSDIDAKNLPSTSDDGQYVLTAKKVGETITYTWVKMDLTTEEQGQ